MIFLKLMGWVIYKMAMRNARRAGGVYIGEKTNAEIDGFVLKDDQDSYSNPHGL